MNLVKLHDTKLMHRNLLLYTNNKRSEREIKETILSIIETKIIKYLGIKIPNEKKRIRKSTREVLLPFLDEPLMTRPEARSLLPSLCQM